MFSKAVLAAPRIWDTVCSTEYPAADDMGFALAAQLAWGSCGWYLPSHGMLRFHGDWKQEALFFRPGHNEALYAQYKSLLEAGYEPVLARIDDPSSPECRAARLLPRKRFSW